MVHIFPSNHRNQFLVVSSKSYLIFNNLKMAELNGWPLWKTGSLLKNRKSLEKPGLFWKTGTPFGKPWLLENWEISMIWPFTHKSAVAMNNSTVCLSIRTYDYLQTFIAGLEISGSDFFSWRTFGCLQFLVLVRPVCVGFHNFCNTCYEPVDWHIKLMCSLIVPSSLILISKSRTTPRIMNLGQKEKRFVSGSPEQSSPGWPLNYLFWGRKCVQTWIFFKLSCFLLWQL